LKVQVRSLPGASASADYLFFFTFAGFLHRPAASSETWWQGGVPHRICSRFLDLFLQYPPQPPEKKKRNSPTPTSKVVVDTPAKMQCILV
jgi:hypothetical protein